MRKSVYIFILLFLVSSVICAQSEQASIIQDLNTDKPGQGSIRVMQDEAIQRLVGTHNSVAAIHRSATERKNSSNSETVRVRGWKIQVFSGNNQQTSKREAEARRASVRNAFPELEAAVTYSAPLWRLRVGNFTSKSEAEAQLEEMKKELPGLAREMYLVQDVVNHTKD